MNVTVQKFIMCYMCVRYGTRVGIYCFVCRCPRSLTDDLSFGAYSFVSLITYGSAVDPERCRVQYLFRGRSVSPDPASDRTLNLDQWDKCPL